MNLSKKANTSPIWAYNGVSINADVNDLAAAGKLTGGGIAFV
jgi:hypothetical protein